VLADLSSFWSQTGLNLLVWGVCTLVSNGATALIMWGRFQKTLDVLERGQAAQAREIQDHTARLTALKEERLSCELRAARGYASHGELARLVADSTQQDREVLIRLDSIADGLRGEIQQVHGRVTDVAKQVAALQAVQNEGGPA